MIDVRLQIPGVNSGQVFNTRDYGLVYIDSDKVVGAPSKGFESVSYPEEEGEHIIPRSVDDAFDYKVTFFIQADTVRDVNALIKRFNELLYSKPGGQDVKTYKKVTFYNDYKRHKIVGYPKPISEATEFWRDPSGQIGDVALVEWTIRVTTPSECDFSL